MLRLSLWRTVFSFCCISMAAAAASDSGEFSDHEPAPRALAKDVVPTELMQSFHYKIADDVSSESFYYRFQIEDSRFGTFDADSLYLLKIRTHELNVLARTIDAKGQNEFVKSIGTEIADTAKAAAKTVVTPVKTAKAFAGGVETLSKNAFDFVRRKDRHQPKDSFWTGEEKRKIASQLGLDVYSTNPVVQDFLTRVAQPRSAGSTMVNVGITAATIVVPVGLPVSIAITAVKYREKVSDKLETLSPTDLYRYNEDILSEMAVQKALREQFLEYPGLTPRQKTEIVADLKGLSSVKDKTQILIAAMEPHPASGVWQVECADMLAKYNQSVETIESFATDGAALSARTVNGKSLVVFPADILYWSTEAENAFAEHGEQEKGQRECILSGHVTEWTRIQLEKRGYTIRENFLAPEPEKQANSDDSPGTFSPIEK